MYERKILEYELVQSTSTEDDGGIQFFTNMVNDRIRQGWQPYGGVHSQMMIEDGGGIIGKAIGQKAMAMLLTQAVVRFEEETGEERNKSVWDHPLEEKLWDVQATLERIESHLASIDENTG